MVVGILGPLRFWILGPLRCGNWDALRFWIFGPLRCWNWDRFAFGFLDRCAVGFLDSRCFWTRCAVGIGTRFAFGFLDRCAFGLAALLDRLDKVTKYLDLNTILN